MRTLNHPFFRQLLLCSLVLCFTACASEPEVGQQVEDHFFLQSDDALMPVFVDGNTASGVFVIYLHGGPGNTSLEDRHFSDGGLSRMEKDYALVYWEQRCAGSSQGNCDPTQLTLSQYVTDLHKLLQVLRLRYGATIRIFLLGHSWGGALGVAYMTDPARASGVRGLIEVCGAHQVPRIAELSLLALSARAQRQISLGSQASEWQGLVNAATRLNLNSADGVLDMSRLASDGEDLLSDADSTADGVSSTGFTYALFSPADPIAAAENERRTIQNFKYELAQIDLSSTSRAIQAPYLLISGAFDLRVPPQFVTESFQQATSPNKQLRILPRSAHFPHRNEPQAFQAAVTAFIDLHR